jgi:ABC-2 type transport system permease protein
MKWRSLRTAAWLGWQIESNWTDPFLFAVYSVVKPLTSAGILVVMYALVTHGDFGSTGFSYMYIGNAFYMYVGAIMTGMSQAVVEDRERYRTLKSVYIAPIDFRLYLVGRGIARFVTGSAAVLITITFGVLFLHVGVALGEVRWVPFLAALAIGIVMLSMLGLALASCVMIMVHQSWAVGDAVAAALFLFTGAIFPLAVLPGFLRPIGFILPITYWLELLRRTLVGRVAVEFPTLAALGDRELFGILLLSTLALTVTALKVFQIADSYARERGLIDRTTNY